MSKLPTRAERFRVIRDAIMSMVETTPDKDVFGLKQLIAPFEVHYYRNVPGYGPHNVQIWPAAKIDAHCGWMVELGDKVANVSWDDHDNVEITSFKSGPWEEQIVALIENGFHLDAVAKSLCEKALSLINPFGEVDLGGDIQPERTLELGKYRIIYGVPFGDTPSNIRISLGDTILFGMDWTDDDAAVRAIMGGTWQRDFLGLSSPAPGSHTVQ